VIAVSETAVKYLKDLPTEVEFPFTHTVLNLPLIQSHSISSNATKTTIEEIVFVGDLSAAHGLDVFCDAIDYLVKLTSNHFKISFYGRPDMISELNSNEYIQLRAVAWESYGIKWSISRNYDTKSILDYVTGSLKALVVMPSLADASCVLERELAFLGIPFVGSHSSAIQEYIDQNSRSNFLVEPKGSAVASKINYLIEHPGMTFE